MHDFKIYPSNLRHHKKSKNNRTKFVDVRANLFFPPSLASGKPPIKLKEANGSINTREVEFVL